MPAFAPGQIISVSLLNDVLGNTGVLTNLDITAQAGWEFLISEHHIVAGKLMTLRVQIRRTGWNLVASGPSDGNPGNVPDQHMATINDVSKRPTMQVFDVAQGSVTSGAAELRTDGILWLTDLHTSSHLNTGETIECQVVYPIP